MVREATNDRARAPIGAGTRRATLVAIALLGAPLALDDSGPDFIAALDDNTTEGGFSQPAYGGTMGDQVRMSFGYAGGTGAA